MSRIFVMGSGVVGTATGRGFLQMGHDVTFIDISDKRIEALRADGLDARRSLDLRDERASFIFLTLPTPHEQQRYDLSVFTTGVEDVGRALRNSDAVHTVVVRSTVPPMTTDGLVKPTLQEVSGKVEGLDFCLASNPEFLRAASAADDFRWPWMTVIGAHSKRVAERLRDLLAPFGGELRMFDSPATTEMIKCVHNIFNASKISFWNEIWQVCERIGVDHDAVANTVARSAEGSTNITYGIRGGAPYGGVCLPKDTNGFLGFAGGIGVAMPLLSAVVAVNDGMVARLDQEIDELGFSRVLPGSADAPGSLAA